MNFLAHAFLAESHAESILGNLMADFVKGRIESTLAPRVREGIFLHRQVDAFADRHPGFRRSVQRLRKRWRHYSPILVDMFCDHFLAAEWERYSDRSLREFADHVYAALRPCHNGLSERMQTAIDRMIQYDWLASYADQGNIEISLARISQRSRNPDLHLERGMADLEQHRDGLTADFHSFFPELIEFAERVKRNGHQ